MGESFCQSYTTYVIFLLQSVCLYHAALFVLNNQPKKKKICLFQMKEVGV